LRGQISWELIQDVKKVVLDCIQGDPTEIQGDSKVGLPEKNKNIQNRSNLVFEGSNQFRINTGCQKSCFGLYTGWTHKIQDDSKFHKNKIFQNFSNLVFEGSNQFRIHQGYQKSCLGLDTGWSNHNTGWFQVV